MANEYVIAIVPLFSNSKNNSLQSVFYTAPLHNKDLKCNNSSNQDHTISDDCIPPT